MPPNTSTTSSARVTPAPIPEAPTEQFECVGCGQAWQTEEDAIDCCAPRCGSCGERHETDDEAYTCCRYSCPSCGAWYDYENDADDCCTYRCPSCGERYDNSDGALACCRRSGEFPSSIHNVRADYLVAVPDLPGRPSRACSIEQEISGGGSSAAAMLHEMGYADSSYIGEYNDDGGERSIIVKEDGSLPEDGAEIVYSRFQLHRATDVNKLSKVLALMRHLKNTGYVRTSMAAGTHIHLSAQTPLGQLFGPGQMASLYEIFSFCEDVLFRIAAVGWRDHRGTSYTAPLPRMDKVTPGKVAKNSRSSRYFSLNFERLLSAAMNCHCGACIAGDWEECNCRSFSHATIEWRVFNASTKPETIHAWLLLAHALTAKAFDHTLDTLEAHPWQATSPEDQTWVLGWILNECPLLPEEQDVILNVARRSPGLNIDWEAIDRMMIEDARPLLMAADDGDLNEDDGEDYDDDDDGY